VSRLNRDEGRTVVMVLHDLNLADRYSDYMAAMKEGSIIASGPIWCGASPHWKGVS
jgi:iron complex transport system ATP-binding protein